MPKIKLKLSSNAIEWSHWMATVPREVQLEIENRRLPFLKTATKAKVKENLTPGHGVEEGIYKKSFIINSYAESKWQLGFQVFAKKPHYRLTHLLEGREELPGGHRIKVFTPGRGSPTKWGNIGMSFVRTNDRPNGYTNKVIHIEPAQQYAEERIGKLYEDAYTGKLLERMTKI